jgi:hypothetical protein
MASSTLADRPRPGHALIRGNRSPIRPPLFSTPLGWVLSSFHDCCVSYHKRQVVGFLERPLEDEGLELILCHYVVAGMSGTRRCLRPGTRSRGWRWWSTSSCSGRRWRRRSSASTEQGAAGRRTTRCRVAIEHVFAAQKCRLDLVIRSAWPGPRPGSGSPIWSPTCAAWCGSRPERPRPEEPAAKAGRRTPRRGQPFRR